MASNIFTRKAHWNIISKYTDGVINIPDYIKTIQNKAVTVYYKHRNIDLFDANVIIFSDGKCFFCGDQIKSYIVSQNGNTIILRITSNSVVRLIWQDDMGKLRRHISYRLKIYISKHINVVIKKEYYFIGTATYHKIYLSLILQQYAKCEFISMSILTPSLHTLLSDFLFLFLYQGSEIIFFNNLFPCKLHDFYLSIVLKGRGAKCWFYGISSPVNTSIHSHRILIEHMADETLSSLELRNYVCKKSKCLSYVTSKINSFQKIESYIYLKGLMLHSAFIMLLPIFEILTDSVIAKHGANIYRPDRSLIDYLSSKGVPLSIIHQILIESFLMSAVPINMQHMYKSLYLDPFLDKILSRR